MTESCVGLVLCTFLQSCQILYAAQDLCSEVVIDLYCHPDGSKRLKFAQVFVVLSRVKTRENIRLVAHPNASAQQAYGYITELKPHPDVIAFYKGFKQSTNGAFIWDTNQALS